MIYKKIDLELIVEAQDCEAVITELNATLDRLEEGRTIYGGRIETVAVEHRGTQRKSALMHTRAAGETAASALRTAGEKVTSALRHVI